MLAELIFGTLFVGVTAPVVFPELTDAWHCFNAQQGNVAVTSEGENIAPWMSKESSTRNATTLPVGTVVYFSDNSNLTIVSGYNTHVQCDSSGKVWYFTIIGES